MEVEVSIQFLESFFPHGMWGDPYRASFEYGKRFATHFGPTYGTGDVITLEVGNEPVGFASEHYR